MKSLFSLFAPGADRPRIEDPERVDQLYRRLRRSVLITLVVTYGVTYTARLGLSVVKKPLIDQGIYNAVELGWIGAAMTVGYTMGRLINGFLADRVNVRVFIPVGLALSALINIGMGLNTILALAIALWLANGWFQGFCGPACVVSLTHWFSGRERGSVYGLWSSAHSIGEGITFVVTSTLVALTVWRAAFIGPGIWCIAFAIAAYFGLRDRPETEGLPPVAEWKDDVAVEPRRARGRDLLRVQLGLLTIPAIWIIGLASMCMYMTRYAINSWAILYVQEAHGFSTITAGALVGINAWAGIAGCIAYGVISDRFFGARRPPLTLIFGVLEIASLFVIFSGPTGNAWVIGIGFAIYGFTLSGLLAVLGGLFAVDIVPREATGAAMGVIGLFSYTGATLQDIVSGVLIERGTTTVNGLKQYDFSAPVTFWIGASVMSAILAATLWRVRPRP
jgi:MFS transporter, OPA family, sugar phosphate sensor protein UhpC